MPDLIIVDGGKGQLSSACRELQRLGLHELPIIGLAKEYEEIYRPGRALPLVLPPDSGALRLLQRIRDEAHRFANTYHQLLMKKRIGESILDDCPGVSQNRKNLLLRKFGSVNRLRKATVKQIAATEGIGPKLAEEVHRFLAHSSILTISLDFSLVDYANAFKFPLVFSQTARRFWLDLVHRDRRTSPSLFAWATRTLACARRNAV